MRVSIAALTLAITAALASPAVARDDQSGSPTRPGPQASTPRPQAKPAAKKPTPKRGFEAYFILDQEAMSAADTFNATVGTASFTGVGGGVDLRHVWRDAFVRVAFSTTSQSGSRAYSIGGTVIPLGIPLDLRLTQTEIGGGWRAGRKKWPRFEFYGGAALLVALYSEESQFAQSDENSSDTFTGASVFAGVDMIVWKWVTAGAEVAFRSVPNALGSGGLSKVYNERSLGGTALRVLVGVRRQKK